MNIQRAWKLQRPEGNAIAYVRLRDFFSMIIAATVQFVRQSAFVRQRFAAEIGGWPRPPCPPASQASRSARPTRKSGRLAIVACPDVPAKIFRLTRRANQMH